MAKPVLIGASAKRAAPAKLNLRLKIVGRQSDGYHRLSMLNVSTSLADEVELHIVEPPVVALRSLELAPEFLDSCGCPREAAEIDTVLRDPQRNLALRAARQFLDAYSIPYGVEVKLVKRIPSGSGMGGGSSDAAAVLNLLLQLFGTYLGEIIGQEERGFSSKVAEIALALGADVPYFVEGGLRVVSGIGEQLCSAPQGLERFLTEYPVFVVVPRQSSSSAAVYARVRATCKNFSPDHELPGVLKKMEGVFDSADLWRLISNDLEEHILADNGELGILLEKLRVIEDAIVSFTGSGSAIFILPRSRENAGEVGESVAKVTPSAWALRLLQVLEGPRPRGPNAGAR